MGNALDTTARRRPDQYRGSPNTEPESENDEDCHEFVDKARKRLRIVTTQYRESYLQKVLIAPGMDIQDVTDENAADVQKFLKEFPEAEEFTQLRFRLHQVTFCWTAVLENKEDIAEWDDQAQFWYTKVQGYRKKKTGVDYGLIKQMIDPQAEHNKRRSKALHMLSTNQIIREPGAVTDPEVARIEANKPDGDIEVTGNGRFEINRNIDMGTAQLQMLQESKAELENAGIPRELEGMSNASSGREFQLRQQTQVTALRKLFRNSRNSRLQVGRLWIKMIQHYWTAEMALKVTDDPTAPTYILNKPAVGPDGKPLPGPDGQPMVDDEGKPLVINDLSAGKYDLVVEESPEYVNLESETFAQLSALALKGFPVPPALLISVAPVPDRDKWVQMIQEQQQAQQQALIAAAQAKAQAHAHGAGAQSAAIPQGGPPLVS